MIGYLKLKYRKYGRKNDDYFCTFHFGNVRPIFLTRLGSTGAEINDIDADLFFILLSRTCTIIYEIV